MKKLKVDDELVRISGGNRFNSEKTYMFQKVVRLTSTRAVLDDDSHIVNKEVGFGNYLQHGGGKWQLATKELKAEAAKEQTLKDASTWYWIKYGRANPPREDLLLFQEAIEKEEKAQQPLSEVEQQGKVIKSTNQYYGNLSVEEKLQALSSEVIKIAIEFQKIDHHTNSETVQKGIGKCGCLLSTILADYDTDCRTSLFVAMKVAVIEMNKSKNKTDET